MIKAIQEITVSEGVDPRESRHRRRRRRRRHSISCRSRASSAAPRILPKTASAMSACGMQFSDIVFEQTRKPLHDSGELRPRRRQRRAGRNRGRDSSASARAARRGARGSRIEYFVEARYPSQVWELDTPLPVKRFRSEADVAALVEAFHAVHERVFAVRDDQASRSNASTGAAG